MVKRRSHQMPPAPALRGRDNSGQLSRSGRLGSGESGRRTQADLHNAAPTPGSCGRMLLPCFAAIQQLTAPWSQRARQPHHLRWSCLYRLQHLLLEHQCRPTNLVGSLLRRPMWAGPHTDPRKLLQRSRWGSLFQSREALTRTHHTDRRRLSPHLLTLTPRAGRHGSAAPAGFFKNGLSAANALGLKVEVPWTTLPGDLNFAAIGDLTVSFSTGNTHTCQAGPSD
jgi:hypothetical protein